MKSVFVLIIFNLLLVQDQPQIEIYNGTPARWFWAGQRIDKPFSPHDYVFVGLAKLNLQGDAYFEAHGGRIRPLPVRSPWLVFRIHPYHKLAELKEMILSVTQQWQVLNPHTYGIQLDIDWPTAKLHSYSQSLRNFRAYMPKELKLGITGLSDWMIQGNRLELKELRQQVDEMVVQTYQGRNPVRVLPLLVDKLNSSPIDIKLGVLPEMLEPPFFWKRLKKVKGLVVFYPLNNTKKNITETTF